MQRSGSCPSISWQRPTPGATVGRQSGTRRGALIRGAAAAVAIVLAACAPAGDATRPQTAGAIHLDAILDSATVETAAAPGLALVRREWDLADPATPWRTFSSAVRPSLADVERSALADGIRLALSPPETRSTMLLAAGLSIDLPELRLGDWEAVEVRARSEDRFGGITVAYNHRQEGALPQDLAFFLSTDEVPPVFSDGSEQRYSIPLRQREGDGPETALTSLVVLVAAPDPGQIDLLSVALVPRGAAYSESVGRRTVHRGGLTRQAMYAHAPSEIRYPIEVPPGGRLDVGLTVEGGEAVTYEVRVEAPGTPGDAVWTETISAAETWAQRSIDLADWVGRSIELTLVARSEREGAVAVWGAPVVSGSTPSERPNVIFYVIDGGGADLMSVYGYERATTPFLQELAAEGVVFERAHSNSTWTQPSTASFMTSLHHSVLGGLRRGVHSTPIPVAATTMAEHMRAGGYTTASFTTNPNAGRIIGTERGVDLMSDADSDHHSTSSVDLHERFWEFRDSYPGSPYWVHFQTTDVHEPNEPAAPHAGTFVAAVEHEQNKEWDKKIFQVAWQEFGQRSVQSFYDLALERAGIDRKQYFSTRKGLYDETMLHQDAQLRALVERLKARGEWRNTLLIIGSDHGHPAGTFARFGRGLLDPQPEPWQGALLDSYATRVPLIFVWPAGIPGGRRFPEPVSMIDVLPTVLDLAGLPPPEVGQGQSLAPFLRGAGDMAVRPVILDEFRVDDTSGRMIGNLEIIDGRWGASLEIAPRADGDPAGTGRHVVPIGGRWGARHEFYPEPSRLLLYDLEADPFATRAVNDEHPELVARYEKILAEQWRAHQALATRFRETHEVSLDPAQLEQLRSLGYIR